MLLILVLQILVFKFGKCWNGIPLEYTKGFAIHDSLITKEYFPRRAAPNCKYMWNYKNISTCFHLTWWTHFHPQQKSEKNPTFINWVDTPTKKTIGLHGVVENKVVPAPYEGGPSMYGNWVEPLGWFRSRVSSYLGGTCWCSKKMLDMVASNVSTALYYTFKIGFNRWIYKQQLYLVVFRQLVLIQQSKMVFWGHFLWRMWRKTNPMASKPDKNHSF